MKDKQEIMVGLTLVGIALVLLLCISFKTETPEYTMADFYQAVAQVESGGDDLAVGSHAEIGRYQITEGYWKDAIEYANIGGSYDNCFLPSYSKVVMESYFRRYANKDWHDNNYYNLARIHNGGPRGKSKNHTKAYADKVMEAMTRG